MSNGAKRFSTFVCDKAFLLCNLAGNQGKENRLRLGLGEVEANLHANIIFNGLAIQQEGFVFPALDGIHSRIPQHGGTADHFHFADRSLLTDPRTHHDDTGDAHGPGRLWVERLYP